ncbi:MAG: sulfite exporter TauE/SafE family protein [Thermoleophilia bacterium]
MTTTGLLLVSGAGFLAGAVNGVAGGGSLISFPALLAVGYGSVPANVTNQVAVLPGYLGGSIAYREELQGQGPRIRTLGLTSAAGGLLGSLLLLVSPEAVFRQLVPFLILLSCALLAAQPLLARLVQRSGAGGSRRSLLAAQLSVSVYGGYFGAGLGIMMLALLGSFLRDDLHRVNALKGVLSLVIGLASAAFFALFGPVAWTAAGVMAVASLVGGQLGVKVARRVGATTLRTVVVLFGIAVAIQLMR